MSPVLLAFLTVVAVLLLLPTPPRAARVRGSTPRRRVPRPGARAAASVVAAGATLLVGGSPGMVVGLSLAVATLAVLPRLEPAGRRRDRDRLERRVPLAVDLVAACLASGAGLEASLDAAARAVGEPASRILRGATSALRLGADPAVVWLEVAEHEALGGLARAVSRSQETGAPLADLLPRVADQARAAHRARVETRVRTAAVRLTAPLGVAFLPAFVLLGVVPVVASWVGVLF